MRLLRRRGRSSLQQQPWLPLVPISRPSTLPRSYPPPHFTKMQSEDQRDGGAHLNTLRKWHIARVSPPGVFHADGRSCLRPSFEPVRSMSQVGSSVAGAPLQQQPGCRSIPDRDRTARSRKRHAPESTHERTERDEAGLHEQGARSKRIPPLGIPLTIRIYSLPIPGLQNDGRDSL